MINLFFLSFFINKKTLEFSLRNIRDVFLSYFSTFSKRLSANNDVLNIVLKDIKDNVSTLLVTLVATYINTLKYTIKAFSI